MNQKIRASIRVQREGAAHSPSALLVHDFRGSKQPSAFHAGWKDPTGGRGQQPPRLQEGRHRRISWGLGWEPGTGRGLSLNNPGHHDWSDGSHGASAPPLLFALLC